MAKQFGDWGAVLREANKFTEPDDLESDLHVTRATFLPGANGSDQCVSVYFKVKDGPARKLCDLRSRESAEMDRVFACGASLRFAVGPLPGGGRVRLEGHFGTDTGSHTLAGQLTGAEHRLAVHVTSTATELARQIETVSRHQQLTIVRLETELSRSHEEKKTLEAELAELKRKLQAAEEWIDTLQGNRWPGQD